MFGLDLGLEFFSTVMKSNFFFWPSCNRRSALINIERNERLKLAMSSDPNSGPVLCRVQIRPFFEGRTQTMVFFRIECESGKSKAGTATVELWRQPWGREVRAEEPCPGPGRRPSQGAGQALRPHHHHGMLRTHGAPVRRIPDPDDLRVRIRFSSRRPDPDPVFSRRSDHSVKSHPDQKACL